MKYGWIFILDRKFWNDHVHIHFRYESNSNSLKRRVSRAFISVKLQVQVLSVFSIHSNFSKCFQIVHSFSFIQFSKILYNSGHHSNRSIALIVSTKKKSNNIPSALLYPPFWLFNKWINRKNMKIHIKKPQRYIFFLIFKTFFIHLNKRHTIER